MKNMKGKLNSLTEIVFLVAIVRHIYNAFITLISLVQIGFDIHIILNLVISLFAIIIIYNMIMVKKWSLYAFFILSVISALLSALFTGDVINNLIVGLILLLIVCGLLFLKKNGITGWKAFLEKK